MTNAKLDKSTTPDVTNHPRYHPAKPPDYRCGCGAGADVWDSWGVYCARCYLEQQMKKQG